MKEKFRRAGATVVELGEPGKDILSPSLPPPPPMSDGVRPLHPQIPESMWEFHGHKNMHVWLVCSISITSRLRTPVYVKSRRHVHLKKQSRPQSKTSTVPDHPAEETDFAWPTPGTKVQQPRHQAALIPEHSLAIKTTFLAALDVESTTLATLLSPRDPTH